MTNSHIWQEIQGWLDAQLIRVNQSQLADALGVQRQTVSQWKSGETRPSPEKLRRLHEVTRIPYPVLTDALLRDMGYREDVRNDGRSAPTPRAGGSPATVTPIRSGPSPEALDPTLPDDVALAARDEDAPMRADQDRRRQDDDAGES